MPELVIACDLGTGGNKAALYDEGGRCLARRVVLYPTFRPRPGFHEQAPEDWWRALIQSVRELLAETRVNPSAVRALGISGHSLGCVPVDRTGDLLLPRVPIWSDSRAEAEAAAFFERVDEESWYLKTGNGFPPALYTLFKVMWLQRHHPEVYRRTDKILGTKDYLNFRLTGVLATDASYASGSGAYDLHHGRYDADLLSASGLKPSLFPPILPSTAVLGPLTEAAAEALGLSTATRVVAGGVDNSCMALGAGNLREGDVYNALGSSAWIAVTTGKPLLDCAVRPFVFAHLVPGMFNSATSIFSAGTSATWACERFSGGLPTDGNPEEAFGAMLALAEAAPPGANGLLFVPTLGGGTYAEGGPGVRGALLRLDLSHTRADVLRAVLEGVAFGLRVALDHLRSLTDVRTEMLLLGGGARSRFCRQIHADVYGCPVVKTAVDQEAAALGAAALAWVGTGVWPDFSGVLAAHGVRDRLEPDRENLARYAKLRPANRRAAELQAELARLLT